jgi:hypothetical protein
LEGDLNTRFKYLLISITLLAIILSYFFPSFVDKVYATSNSGITAIDRTKITNNVPITSWAQIQPALDAAYAAGGGVVEVGEVDLYQAGALTIKDKVTLKGQGIGKTIFRNDTLRRYINMQGDHPRLTGISFISSVPTPSGSTVYGNSGVYINGASNFRVDHCHIEGFSAIGIWCHNQPNGVIDHNEIDTPNVTDMAYGVYVEANSVWGTIQLGTADSVFVEDNVFTRGRHACVAQHAGHYVFRYNLCLHGYLSHRVDVHGDRAADGMGGRWIEIYENTFEQPDSGSETVMGIRGGGGVIWGNTITGYSYDVELFIEAEQVGLPYPITHQVGDLYIWNNVHNGGAQRVTVDHNATNQIKVNRDYFLTAKSGYAPYQYPHPLTLGDEQTVTVVTNAASAITANTAILNAALNSMGSSSSVVASFEYGTTTIYGQVVSGVPATLSAPGAFTANLTGLTPSTLYHYRAKAIGDDTAYGGDQTFTTLASNNAPVLNTIGNKTVSEGQNLSFTISASDLNGDPLTYSASNLPLGSAFNASTRTFSWTPSSTQSGTYANVHFQVTDGTLSDAENITITVGEETTYADWDVNMDGATNVLDMTIVGQHFSETGISSWIRSDVSKDGVVNILDQIIIGQHIQ